MLHAERSQNLGKLGEMVTRHGRENMVLDLIVQASAQPIGEPMWVNIPGGAHLQTDKVYSPQLIKREHVHSIVTDCEDDAKQHTGTCLGRHGVDNGLRHRIHQRDFDDKQKEQRVVDNQTSDLCHVHCLARHVRVRFRDVVLRRLD